MCHVNSTIALDRNSPHIELIQDSLFRLKTWLLNYPVYLGRILIYNEGYLQARRTRHP